MKVQDIVHVRFQNITHIFCCITLELRNRGLSSNGATGAMYKRVCKVAHVQKVRMYYAIQQRCPESMVMKRLRSLFSALILTREPFVTQIQSMLQCVPEQPSQERQRYNLQETPLFLVKYLINYPPTAILIFQPGVFIYCKCNTTLLSSHKVNATHT